MNQGTIYRFRNKPVGVLQTRVEEVKQSFKWSINDFLQLFDQRNECLVSPIISTGDELTKWCLQIEFQGLHDNVEPGVSLLVKMLESKKFAVKAKWQIGIMKADGVVANVFETPQDFSFKSEGGCTWACSTFLKKDVLQREAHLLPDGVLTIVGDIVEDIYESVIISDHSKEVKVVSDLQNLLDSQRLFDVVLVVAGKELKAHKAVLAARSSVFAAMFEHDMNKEEMNRVEITDVEPDVMEETLNYIYTGQVKRLMEISRGLFLASEKFDLKGLKVLCENAISEGLSVENAPDLLIFAHRHSANHLKAQVLEFIKTNKFDVMGTEGWYSLLTEYTKVVPDVVRALPEEEEDRYVSSGPPAKKARK